MSRSLKLWVLFSVLCLPIDGLYAEDPRTIEDAKRVKVVLEQSLKTDPNNSELWSHLGFTNNKLEDVDGAQAAFEKAVSLNPKHENGYFMLGLIYEKKKMKDEAINAWKTFLSVSNDKFRQDMAKKHIHHLSND